jgi:hypothetical protein
MLLTAKAYAEGGRALQIYCTVLQIDKRAQPAPTRCAKEGRRGRWRC